MGQTTDDLERIVIVMMGYNPQKYSLRKRTLEKLGSVGKSSRLEWFLQRTIGYEAASVLLKKALIKIFYGEELIDTRNKGAIVLDERTGKQVIEYSVDALQQIGNTHLIVVGDDSPELGDNRLENILSKQDRPYVQIVQMGDSFYENLKKGERVWEMLYDDLTSEGHNVSPHKFFVFGDTFDATPESLEETFRIIEERDADFTFAMCKRMEEGEKDPRQLFIYRPWTHGGDGDFRNSNIGAVRHQTGDDIKQRGLPDEREYLISAGYQVRKIFAPTNFLVLMKYAFRMGAQYKLSTKFPFSLVVRMLTIPKITDKAEELFSTKDYRPKLVFLPVANNLESDIDSRKDVKRARKMIGMRYLDDATIDDCVEKYEACVDIGSKRVEFFGLDVTRASLEDVKSEIQLLQEDVSKSFYYHPEIDVNYAAALLYDLNEAYEQRFEQNKIRIGANIENTINFLLKHQWDPGTSQIVSNGFDRAIINFLLRENRLYQGLIENFFQVPLNSQQKRQVLKNIRNINMIEGHKLSKEEMYDHVRADNVIAKYCSNR